MHPRIPRLFFGSLLILAATFVAVTSAWLPDSVASHFGAEGNANGYMTREGYRLFMLAFTIIFPLFVTGVVALGTRLVPTRYVNIPNRDYWLAPERREQTLAYLTTHALRLGCVMVLFSAGIHWLVMRANASTPPRLENGLFLAVLGAFVVAIVAWIGALMWRFRKPV